MITLTIAIDEQLAHALLVAKCDYFSHSVLPAESNCHKYRIANHQRLDSLYVAIRAALDAPVDASIA